jgi:hypothetical protein
LKWEVGRRKTEKKKVRRYEGGKVRGGEKEGERVRR